MLVGRIKNHHQRYSFSRGEEKGMFEYGGSTVVLMTMPGAVEIDSVFLENTEEGYETVVKMGEKIGVKTK
jgi:phosphatidylserine decarboxylase